MEHPEDPDVVALATGWRTPAAMQRQIVQARRRFGWRPLLVAHYSEIGADPMANLEDLDAVFSFALTVGKNCRHERHWRSPHLARHLAERRRLLPNGLWARPKTRFCNFIYSNSTVGEPPVREAFARALMGHNRVDCPGRCLTNTFRLPPNTPGSDAGALAKLAYMSSYRFTVAFENTSADHYLTEKILHALLAGSIPIYWGCPQVAEYYNPDSFVNCHAYGTFDEAIERVLAIEADPALAERMRRAPMLHGDSRFPALHARLEERYAELAAAARRGRRAARSCRRPGRGPWLPAVERRRRSRALLGRWLLLELDPRPRVATGRRWALAAVRGTVARVRARTGSFAAALAAGLGQALAEARHVRGRRTAVRYCAWLGRRCRWMVLRVLGREGMGAVEMAPVPSPSPRRAPRTHARPRIGVPANPPGRVRDGDAPVDPRRHNPVGWTANVEPRVAALGPPALLPRGALAGRTVAADDRTALRRTHHLEDIAAYHADAAARARTLVRIAACGLPVRLLDRHSELAPLLGRELHDAMTAEIPLDDLAGREAASVRARRLALRDHALRDRPWPTVSVLLATRRPDRLADAMASVARQDYPRLELVLALHGDGFTGVPAAARPGLALRVVRVGGGRTLGEVLEAAAAAARGELLAKMDDDDCYDAAHITDLVLARSYSGAALVGKGPEIVYLAGRDVTVRRGRWRAERHATDIAGGGLLLGRADIARAGGWRPLPWGVDQALAADVLASGGSVYRTHGLGFLLVRHGRGHAWEADERRFLADADVVHRGWRPDLAGIGDGPCPV